MVFLLNPFNLGDLFTFRAKGKQCFKEITTLVVKKQNLASFVLNQGFLA